MKTILVLGAGRSSTALITYLLKEALVHDWHIMVGDLSIQGAVEKINGSPRGQAILFDIHQQVESNEAIAQADVVISLLPATLHPMVAQYCLQKKKHLLTASYVSDEMQSFHKDASVNDLLFLNECGLDPGVDHMSAMQMIDKIKKEDGSIISFESFTGGLIAPETDRENPWRYKFTWNPRNVVTAGQSTAKYLHNGKYTYIPYQQLFKRALPIHVSGYGDYEGYANRDSLKYIETYGLQGIKTMLRGTLRNKGFCSAWNVLIQTGCCDDTYVMEEVQDMTHRSFVNSFLHDDDTLSVDKKLANYFLLDEGGGEMDRLRWSGLFSDELVGLTTGTPAQILEHILNKKWKLNSEDKDFIVMWHRLVVEQDGKQKEIQASMVAKGNDASHTAMAKTVGWPLGIAAKLLLTGKIKSRGVVIPITPEFYDPILLELKNLGIELMEKKVML